MNNVISELFGSLKRRQEIRSLIPMGYTPGIPVLVSRQDELCVVVPFLRYRTTGEKDRTLVYPVKYTATYMIPEKQMIAFENLAYRPMAETVDFDKPVGYFRHEAIKNLDKAGYAELREAVLTGLDRLAMAMLGEAEFDAVAADELAERMGRIVEPSLHLFYKSLVPNFYKRYINGKD